MRTHARRTVLTLCAIMMALALPVASHARTLQQVLNGGTLRVGVVLATPWVLRKPDGELTGFEIDVAKQLAQDMGLKVEFQIYGWDRIIKALERGEVDLIAAGLSITPERALHVNFSRPYAEGGITLAASTERTAGATDLASLNSDRYTIAVVAKTVAEELAHRVLPQAKLAVFADADAARAALVGGSVDGYLDEEPVPTFLALENPDKIDVPLAEPLLRAPTAFAVNKGDPDFLAYLDAWITARDADTWLGTMHDYWFGTLLWRRQLQDAPGAH
jgi:polar amino acid transport system substrate-binding protein